MEVVFDYAKVFHVEWCFFVGDGDFVAGAFDFEALTVYCGRGQERCFDALLEPFWGIAFVGGDVFGGF